MRVCTLCAYSVCTNTCQVTQICNICLRCILLTVETRHKDVQKIQKPVEETLWSLGLEAKHCVCEEHPGPQQTKPRGAVAVHSPPALLTGWAAGWHLFGSNHKSPG